MAPGNARVSSRASQRVQRFADSENSKAPEERLVNRDDLEDTVFRNLSAARMRSFEQVKEWFVEFATHDNIQLCTATEALEYFKEDGTLFTLKVTRQFVMYLAMSREDFLVNPETGRKDMHVNTIISHLIILEISARRSLNPIDSDIIENTKDWIRYKMVEDKLLNRVSASKPVSMPKDVTTLLQTIFSVRYMATLRNTREALNLALFANMFTDASNRPNELVNQGNKKYFEVEASDIYRIPRKPRSTREGLRQDSLR